MQINDPYSDVTSEQNKFKKFSSFFKNKIRVLLIDVRYVPQYLGVNRSGRILRTLADIRRGVVTQNGSVTIASRQGGNIQIGGSNCSNVEILRNSSVRNREFKVESRIFSFKFKTPNDDEPFENFLLNAFNDFLTYARENVSNNHLMGVKLNVIVDE